MIFWLRSVIRHQPVPVISASASANPPAKKDPIWGLTDEEFKKVNAKKNEAYWSCVNNGHVPAMGFGWEVVCIEGNVRSFDAKTEEYRQSKTYDPHR